MSKAEAAVELMRFSKNLRRFSRRGLGLTPRLVDAAACYRLTRNDDLGAAADVVIRLMEAD
jgi:hypothetical protein